MKAPSCRVCGRVLRSQASKAAGVGPVCERRSRAHTANRLATTAHPNPSHHPGQTEIPLNDTPTA